MAQFDVLLFVPALCLSRAESVEVFVPAVRTNDSYHWFSVANNTDNIETFFSEDVIDRDVIGKQCVTLLGSNFTAQDCASSQFRFICQRGQFAVRDMNRNTHDLALRWSE